MVLHFVLCGVYLLLKCKGICSPFLWLIYSTLVANSDDVLRNPALIFENVARVKRFVVARGYTGPVSVAGDCTKVRAWLSYSTDFGSHILGSTLPLNECEVDDVDDIDEIIDRIKKKKVMASQVRAILVKVHIDFSTPAS